MANLVVSVLPFPPDSDALMLPRSAPTRRSFRVERWVHSSLGGAKGTSQAKARAAQLRCVFVAFHVKVRDVFVQLVAVGVENAHKSARGHDTRTVLAHSMYVQTLQSTNKYKQLLVFAPGPDVDISLGDAV